jgi:hypothetical protein
VVFFQQAPVLLKLLSKRFIDSLILFIDSIYYYYIQSIYLNEYYIVFKLFLKNVDNSNNLFCFAIFNTIKQYKCLFSILKTIYYSLLNDIQ